MSASTDSPSETVAAHPLSRLPPDILPYIAMFTKNHLQYRLVHSTWDKCICYFHSTNRCMCCKLKSEDFISLSDLVNAKQRLPWISNPDFNISKASTYAQIVSKFQELDSLKSKSPFFAPLRFLSFYLQGFTFKCLKTLVSSSSMSQLSGLCIWFSGESKSKTGALSLITSSPYLSELTTLRLIVCNFSHSDMQSFSTWAPLSKMNEIVFWQPSRATASIAQGSLLFLTSPYFLDSSRNLTRLVLNNKMVDSECLKAIASNSSLCNLKQLDLMNNSEIDSEGIKAVSSSLFLTSLEDLRLNLCHLTDESAQYLANSTSLLALKKLDLSENKIQSEKFVQMFKLPHSSLKALRSVDLRWNPFGGILLLSIDK